MLTRFSLSDEKKLFIIFLSLIGTGMAHQQYIFFEDKKLDILIEYRKNIGIQPFILRKVLTL